MHPLPPTLLSSRLHSLMRWCHICIQSTQTHSVVTAPNELMLSHEHNELYKSIVILLCISTCIYGQSSVLHNPLSHTTSSAVQLWTENQTNFSTVSRSISSVDLVYSLQTIVSFLPKSLSSQTLYVFLPSKSDWAWHVFSINSICWSKICVFFLFAIISLDLSVVARRPLHQHHVQRQDFKFMS